MLKENNKFKTFNNCFKLYFDFNNVV